MSLLQVLYLLVLASACIAAVSGSCLNYGHSCWGAHGKRSGSGSGSEDVSLDNWLISRLLAEGSRRGVPSSTMTRQTPERNWAAAPALPHKVNLQAIRWLTRGRFPFRLLEENLTRGEGEPILGTSEQEMNEIATGSDSSTGHSKDQELVLLEQPPKLIKILDQP
ncbi:unnamed protein product [Bemisia tabaci]|uniref:Uncharacterized protein n=1 Tax=Bemisia tabaci TaxID=7038 RepID=A0A9P0G3B4_BEMTA|nr:unnamed protein product [Bemisia tabaci]